jgi:predicted TIM-barrel fold metal-dependent hydrolase
LRDIAAANPHALLFGTDLPSTRAPRPFQDQDLDLIKQTLTRKQAAKTCFENAVALYRATGLAAGADASV